MPTPTSYKIHRRSALAGLAAAPMALGLSGQRAQAAADMQGPAALPVNRFQLGSMEVTALLAGTRTVPEPKKIFGLNASDEEFAAASAAALIPTDKAQFFFTPTLVNTGNELVLFDTGLDGAGIADALQRAGYTTDQVDKVVITHMHGDHIGGLMTDGNPTFANATYVTGATEYDAWAAMGNEGFDTNVKPLAEKTEMIAGGDSPVSGITAMPAPGHTPGHMAYMLESDGEQLVLIADAANHFIWSVQNPEWEVSFDMDKAQAVASRKELLGMLAADKLPFIGYHMPFPAMGYVTPQDSGFRYVPASYQFMLE